jgi:hypothetical protein
VTSLAKDIDPLVERVILRCLDVDPRNRPGSALAVAAALPGWRSAGCCAGRGGHAHARDGGGIRGYRRDFRADR